MRASSVLLVTAVLLSVGLAVGCQHRTLVVADDITPGPAGDEPEEPVKTKTVAPTSAKDNSCLGKAGLAFDDVECNACMSDNAACCAATVTCFGSDPDCTALHACMATCGGAAAIPAGPPAEVFAKSVFPSINATCGSCHSAGTSGAPIFFGADAATTYPLFKARGFHLANSAFALRLAHTGPALAPDQQSLVAGWVAAEAAAGTGAGDGGGGGTGTGAGDAGGGATGLSCKDACKAKHPNAVTKWQAYNTCAVVTCRAECL